MKRIRAHFAALGFTNRLAVYILLLLCAGLIGGFVLASRCIEYGFTGSLACWTIIFTPIGTACSMVLGKVVDKNKAENTSAEGEGIKYAAQAAKGFEDVKDTSWESPGI